MAKRILCKTCFCAVDCGEKCLCLMEPLFTYTKRTVCKEYQTGIPMTEEEFENPEFIKKEGNKK